MKIILERHAFAPELNCAYLKGCENPVKAPGCKTIKEVRRLLFSPAVLKLKAVVSTHYPPKFKGLEREYKGCIENRTQALRLAKQLRDKNPGAVLNSGDVLPALKTRIKIIGGY